MNQQAYLDFTVLLIDSASLLKLICLHKVIHIGGLVGVHVIVMVLLCDADGIRPLVAFQARGNRVINESSIEVPLLCVCPLLSKKI